MWYLCQFGSESHVDKKLKTPGNQSCYSSMRHIQDCYNPSKPNSICIQYIGNNHLLMCFLSPFFLPGSLFSGIEGVKSLKLIKSMVWINRGEVDQKMHAKKTRRKFSNMLFLWHQTRWTVLSSVVNVPESRFSQSWKESHRIGFGIQKYVKNY